MKKLVIFIVSVIVALALSVVARAQVTTFQVDQQFVDAVNAAIAASKVMPGSGACPAGQVVSALNVAAPPTCVPATAVPTGTNAQLLGYASGTNSPTAFSISGDLGLSGSYAATVNHFALQSDATTGGHAINGSATNGGDQINKISVNGAINPLAYGVVGNGSTDDTTAMQAALTACNLSSSATVDATMIRSLKTTSALTIPASCTLKLGNIAWNVDGPVALLMNDNSNLIGTGKGNTVLTWANGVCVTGSSSGPTSSIGPMIENAGLLGGTSDITIDGVELAGNRANQTCTNSPGIRFWKSSNVRITNSSIHDFPVQSPAIRLTDEGTNTWIQDNWFANNSGGTGSAGNNSAIMLDRPDAGTTDGVWIARNRIDSTTTAEGAGFGTGGIKYNCTVAGSTCENAYITNNTIYPGELTAANVGVGVEAFQSTGAVMTNTHADGNHIICAAGSNTITAISFGGTWQMDVSAIGNQIENCGHTSIEAIADHPVITGNTETLSGINTINGTAMPDTTGTQTTVPGNTIVVASAANFYVGQEIQIVGANTAGADLFPIVTGISGTTFTLDRNIITAVTATAVNSVLSGAVWSNNTLTDTVDASGAGALELTATAPRRVEAATVTGNVFHNPTASAIRAPGNLFDSLVASNLIYGRGSVQTGNGIGVNSGTNNTLEGNHVLNWNAGDSYFLAAGVNNNWLSGNTCDNVTTCYADSGTGNVYNDMASKRVQNIAIPAAAGDALSEGHAIGAVTPAAVTATTEIATTESNPPQRTTVSGATTLGAQSVQLLTMTAAATLTLPSGTYDGQKLAAKVCQNATGGFTPTWAGSINWPNNGTIPTPTTTASEGDWYGWIWNATTAKWDETGFTPGESCS